MLIHVHVVIHPPGDRRERHSFIPYLWCINFFRFAVCPCVCRPVTVYAYGYAQSRKCPERREPCEARSDLPSASRLPRLLILCQRPPALETASSHPQGRNLAPHATPARNRRAESVTPGTGRALDVRLTVRRAQRPTSRVAQHVPQHHAFPPPRLLLTSLRLLTAP